MRNSQKSICLPILFFSFIILNLTSFKLSAFQVEITGKMKGNTYQAVRLYSPQWFEDKILPVEKEGNFGITFESKYPAQYAIYYGEGSNRASQEFFIFNKEKITVEADPLADAAKKIVISGTGKRSKAMEQLDQLFINKYLNALRASRNIDSIMNSYEAEIRSLEGIGKDQYSDVLAITTKLYYLSQLMNPEMRRQFNIFERKEFINLPKYKENFLGFKHYNNLMALYKLKELRDQLKKQNDSSNFFTFTNIYSALEKEKNNIQEVIIKNAKVNLFYTFKSELRTENEKQFYLTELEKFVNENPNFTSVQSLRSHYEALAFSLIGKQAPDFTLRDTVDRMFSLHELRGKFVLMDVWGSWCAPCRRSNKELVKMYDSLKNNPNITFLSIAYDRDMNAWRNAISEDKLSWKQLLFSEEFIREYQINAYPTMFLISPEQKVLVRKTKITYADLKPHLPAR